MKTLLRLTTLKEQIRAFLTLIKAGTTKEKATSKGRRSRRGVLVFEEIIEDLAEATLLKEAHRQIKRENPVAAIAALKHGLKKWPRSTEIATLGFRTARRERRFLTAIDFFRDQTLVPETLASDFLDCLIVAGDHDGASRFLGVASAMRMTDDFAAKRELLGSFAEAVASLRLEMKELAGKDCVVFGSAPDPQFGNDGPKGEPIVCCNGSALTLKRLFGLRPQFSVVHSHVFVRAGASDAEAKSAFEQVEDPGRLIVLSNSMSFKGPEGAHVIDWSLRFLFVRLLIDASVPFLTISTGAFAVVAAFVAGARSVKLVGFSFVEKGHSYNDLKRYRNHVSSDAALYAMLTECGFPIYAESPDIAAVTTRRLD